MTTKLPKTRLTTKTDSLTVCYPQAHAFQDAQQKHFWTANEVDLSKDVQALRTKIDPVEAYAITSRLKLFTHYERRADEFWNDVVRKMYPRPEIQEMCALFGAMELSVHRRVYDKLNQLMFLSTDEFYESYKENPAMKAKMEFIDHHLQHGNDLVRTAAFSFTEGAVLFSSFAFLMSFRANGNNKLPAFGQAVKFSARDESLHAQASAWLYKTRRKELEDIGHDCAQYDALIYEIAEAVREHEHADIKDTFAKGNIPGITEIQMQHFADSRIDFILTQMGLKKLYNVKYNPIADWFDKLVEAVQYVDFFAGESASYVRGWNAEDFDHDDDEETH